MKGNVIIECSIDASGTESIRNCPQTEHPHGTADGEAKECDRSKKHTECCHLAGSKLLGEAVAHKA